MLNIISLGDFSASLPETNVLILFLPETPDALEILNSKILSLLPSSAIVINAGRGSAVNEVDLLHALDENLIAAAALDVTKLEPLPRDNIFWTHPKILLTQHSAGGSIEEENSKVEIFLSNFARFLGNQELNGIVDWKRGY